MPEKGRGSEFLSNHVAQPVVKCLPRTRGQVRQEAQGSKRGLGKSLALRDLKGAGEGWILLVNALNTKEKTKSNRDGKV